MVKTSIYYKPIYCLKIKTKKNCYYKMTCNHRKYGFMLRGLK